MGAHSAEVIAIQEPVQLLAREGDGVALQAVGPLEALPLQALVPDHEAVTLPEQQLHLVALAVAEHEDRLLEGVELHGLLNQQGQSIDLLAHVDRLATQVDAQPGIRPDHRATSTATKRSGRWRGGTGTPCTSRRCSHASSDASSSPCSSAYSLSASCREEAWNRWPSQKACVEVRSVMVSSLLSNDTSLTDTTQRQKMGFVERLRIWCSWGNYDRHHIQAESEAHGIAPRFLSCPHLNLKRIWRRSTGQKKKTGLASALAFHNLAFEGRPHRGVDDARNIVRLLPFMDWELEAELLRGSLRMSEKEHDNRAEVSQAARLTAQAETVFGNVEAARRWLSKPKKRLSGLSPNEAMKDERGAELVDQLLKQIDSGHF